MNSKRELKWKAPAFRIFKSLRNCFLAVIGGFFLFAALANSASAQTRITGTVRDASGEPLIGVSIIEKGTTNGTVTNADGTFTLTVAPNATIEAGYIGFVTQSVKVTGGRNAYDLVLKEDTKSLDEVVVIGYGVQRKLLLTGANSNIKGNAITGVKQTSVMEALQGIAPGVSVTRSSGAPGAGTKVTIRGMGTTGTSKPLYIVDGVAVGDINYLSSSDIQSIDVLKDAASAAIYGARAANGVVLVTTVKGEKNVPPSINYSGYYGVQNMYKKLPSLNAQEYMFIINEA